MRAFVDRYLVAIVGATVGALILSLVLLVVLAGRVADAEERAAAAEQDVETVSNRISDLLVTAAAFTGQFTDLQPAVSGALDEAVTGLDAFAASTIEFVVPIDETIPIETEFVFNRTIDVPVQAVIPIDETVDTTITIQGPLGVEIPIDVTVPVVLDLPIDITFPLTVNETIPISTAIPVRLDVPISIDVGDSELATLAESLRAGLASLQEALGGLGG